MYLQNINEFQKLLDWEGPGRATEKLRETLSEVQGRYFPGHYARIDGVFYGVRPSEGGPVLLAGEREVPLLHGRHTATVRRSDDRVEARVYDGGGLILAVDYKPDPVLEFDPYEGTFQGIFEWLSEQLAISDFYARLTLPAAA